MIPDTQLVSFFLITGGFSLVAFLAAYRLCGHTRLQATFIQNDLCGRDMSKRELRVMYVCSEWTLAPTDRFLSFDDVCGLYHANDWTATYCTLHNHCCTPAIASAAKTAQKRSV